MEPFTTTTQLNKKEYFSFFVKALYKKPATIIVVAIGLYWIITIALNRMNIINFYERTPYFFFVLGIFLVIGPILVSLAATRNLSTTQQNEIQYTFGEEGIKVKAPTCESFLKWEHIIKQKEGGNYLLLYHTRQLANFINKTNLTKEQLKYIKSKVRDSNSK